MLHHLRAEATDAGAGIEDDALTATCPFDTRPCCRRTSAELRDRSSPRCLALPRNLTTMTAPPPPTRKHRGCHRKSPADTGISSFWRARRDGKRHRPRPFRIAAWAYAKTPRSLLRGVSWNESGVLSFYCAHSDLVVGVVEYGFSAATLCVPSITSTGLPAGIDRCPSAPGRSRFRRTRNRRVDVEGSPSTTRDGRSRDAESAGVVVGVCPAPADLRE